MAEAPPDRKFRLGWGSIVWGTQPTWGVLIYVQ